MSLAGAVGVWLMLIGGVVCLGAGAIVAAAVVGWAAGRLRDQILRVKSFDEISVALEYWKASGRPRMRRPEDALDKPIDRLLDEARPSAGQPARQPVQPGRGAGGPGAAGEPGVGR